MDTNVAAAAGIVARYLVNELGFNLDDAAQHAYEVAESIIQEFEEDFDYAWRYRELCK